MELWRLQAVAEVAFWEPRPEFQHLCRAAENGSTLDAVALSAHVPGLSDTGARNLAAHIQYIGLATPEGRLTPLGTFCAATGTAPAWEFGAYDFLIAQHPLIGSTFLDVQRSAANAADYDFKSLTAVPAWLHYKRDEVFVSVHEAHRFSIYDIPEADQGGNCRCTRLDDGELTVTVRDLMTGDNEWHIQGSDVAPSGARSQFASPPKALPSNLFAGLLSRWDRRWDARNNYLAIAFDGWVDPLGRQQFKRRVTYSDVAIGSPGNGKQVVFPVARVDDVPVGPSSREEAFRWAVTVVAGRLEHADAYATQEDWSRLWNAEIVTSLLGNHLDHEVTMNEALNVVGFEVSARTRWLLSACADLAWSAG